MAVKIQRRETGSKQHHQTTTTMTTERQPQQPTYSLLQVPSTSSGHHHSSKNTTRRLQSRARKSGRQAESTSSSERRIDLSATLRTPGAPQQHQSVTTTAANSAVGCPPGTATDQNGVAGDDVPLCSALQRVTIVVLGARGVGKTSLIEQFVYGDVGGPIGSPMTSSSSSSLLTAPEHNSRPGMSGCGNNISNYNSGAGSPLYHHVAVVVDRRLYDVRLVDCPPITRFPVSAVQEWTECRGYGLRHAAAYLIVCDVTDDDSFAYVRSMRDQIVQCRAAAANGCCLGSGGGSTSGSSGSHASPASNNGTMPASAAVMSEHYDVPIVVAANKVDLTVIPPNGNHHQHHGGGSSVGSNLVNGFGGGSDRNGGSLLASSSGGGGGGGGRLQRDFANIVRKQWKCAYVECSARYNWRVMTLFRDMMKAVDTALLEHQNHLSGHRHHHHHHHHGGHLQSAGGSLIRVQNALRNNRCNIL